MSLLPPGLATDRAVVRLWDSGQLVAAFPQESVTGAIRCCSCWFVCLCGAKLGQLLGKSNLMGNIINEKRMAECGLGVAQWRAESARLPGHDASSALSSAGGSNPFHCRTLLASDQR